MDKQEKLEKYGAGPWIDEPDHVEFRHAGFVCLIHRNNLGALCGYVGVAPGHPWHGKDYDDVYEVTPNLSVHYGLTYANECRAPLCHVPAPGEPEHLWWLGFDCAHSGDLCPISFRYLRGRDLEEKYRDIAYVQAETMLLAVQAGHAVEAQS